MTDKATFNIIWHDELTSTNAVLKEQIRNEAVQEFDVICTKHQVAGKGQGSNQWESQKDMNLTFSLLLQPTFIEIQSQFIISKAISLAIIKVLNRYQEGFEIKWPNDIYFNDHKIAGILIENTLINNTIGTAIIGIGININQEVFVSDAPNPISLKQITKQDYSLPTLLNEILQSIAIYYEQLKSNAHSQIDKDYFQSLYRTDAYYPYRDSEGEFRATIHDINEYGHLVLQLKSKETRSYAFKEVEFVIH